MYLAPGGLNASMRPTHDPAMAKAGLAFQSEPITYDRHDLGEQRPILIDRFAGAGWQCDALLAAAQEADDFYFDAFLHVHMPAWMSGRIALVGDAGYCASPLSGMGTSLALVGASPAGELGPADSLDAEQRRPLRTHIGVRHCDQRRGDEMDAAVAIPAERGQGSTKRIRSTCRSIQRIHENVRSIKLPNVVLIAEELRQVRDGTESATCRTHSTGAVRPFEA